MDLQSARYAPMNHAHIPGFPYRIPHKYWQLYLPRFEDEDGDDASLRLVKFHIHIHRLGVKFHEDCLMKMFMEPLEEKERSGYERLPPASLSSLKYFHTVFYKNYKECSQYSSFFEKCCESFETFIQYVGIGIIMKI